MFKIRKFVKKLNSLITEETFRKNIESLILSKLNNEDIKTYISNNSLILTYEDKNITYTITINNNSVEYHIIDTEDKNNTNDIAGKLYKEGSKLIAKYCDSRIYTSGEYQKLKSVSTISTFDENSVEVFKCTTTDYQNYTIKNGKKELIVYDDNGYDPVFYNNLKTRIQMRTLQGNFINITETKYYNDTLKKYDKKTYAIGYGYNDREIHFGGNFTIIPEEVYIDYIKGIISEEELFQKHYVYIKSSTHFAV